MRSLLPFQGAWLQIHGDRPAEVSYQQITLEELP